MIIIPASHAILAQSGDDGMRYDAEELINRGEGYEK